MTEKEKMLKGMLYNANYDNELILDRRKAKDLCKAYNNMDNSDVENKERILRKLFHSIGNNPLIEAQFWCDYGYNIVAGDDFYMNHNGVILDASSVTFGDHVFIGPNCGFYTALHPIEVDIRNQGLEEALPIKVGNNVWFGGNVVVLPGVTIGDNVTIGAGSVVTKDIPSNVVAYGNPCRVVRNIKST